MGCIKFSLRMLFKSIKQCIFYIVSMVFAIMVIFNIFNLLYNNDFVSKDHYGTFSLLTVIILLVSLFLIAFANMYFISGKAKELSIAILSGRSVYNVGTILTIQNMIICIIGIVLGLLAGIGIMPIINTIVYKSAGLEVNPYAFSSLGFLLTSLIIIIQFVFMILVDMGYAYRKEIIDLIKGESNTIDIPITRTKDLEESIKLAGGFSGWYGIPKKKDNEKRKRRKNYIFIFIYILPMLSLLLPINIDNKSQIVITTSFLSIIGILFILKDFIPEKVKNIKEEKYLYKEIQLQSLSNLLYSLRKIKFLIIVSIVSSVVLINLMADKDLLGYEKIITLITFIITVSIMALATNYKVFIEAVNRKRIFKQLFLIGYTGDKIKRILGEEVIFLYGLLLIIPIPQILGVLICNMLSGGIGISFGILIILIYFGVFVLSGLISIWGYKNIIFKAIREV